MRHAESAPFNAREKGIKLRMRSSCHAPNGRASMAGSIAVAALVPALDAIALAIQARIYPITLAVEPGIHAIALTVEVFSRLFMAIGFGPFGGAVEASVNAVAFVVQPVFNPVTLAVEMLFSAITGVRQGVAAASESQCTDRDDGPFIELLHEVVSLDRDDP
ncbi:MAG: hypothetical protein ACRETN_14425 [Nevskiales bacterium]